MIMKSMSEQHDKSASTVDPVRCQIELESDS